MQMNQKDCKNITLCEAFAESQSLYAAKDFIVYRDDNYSYEDVQGMINGFTEFLSNEHIKKGAKICLILPRIPELIISFLAAVKFGAIPVPVNYLLSSKEVNAFIKRGNPAVIVIHSAFVKLLDSEFFYSNKILRVIVDGEVNGFVAWKKACYSSKFMVENTPSADEVAYLNFTTGSTGLPKGAVATHSNLYWNTRSAIETLEIDENDIHLCMFSSFAHPHELFARAIYTGGSIVLLEEVNPKTIVRTINRHNITCMMGLAPMYEMMVNYCSDSKLDSLRIAESGGMYTKPELARNFRRYFNTPILSVWGSTETSGISLANTPESSRDDGSMGKPCPYYDVRLVGDNGNDVGTGEVGELIIRGNGVVEGYDEGISFLSVDGWYYTGDLARIDEDGFYYFVDRKSGMIKVAGSKVYPLQVELVLAQHPCIKEVAIKGVEEKRHGMVPMAFIVPMDGSSTIDIDEIRRFCLDKLANYMIPRKVKILPDLPRIGSGKIDKKALDDK